MKKLIGTFAAFAFAVTASAQSVSDLEAQIQSLMAQIAALTGGSTTTVAAPSSCNFTQTLTLGSTGAEVVELQSFLEAQGKLTIPAGVNKGYFGGLTQSALAAYQAKEGISPAVGYFGPVTRAHVNAKCAPVVVVTPDMDDKDSSAPDASGFDANDGEEADFSDFDVEDADDDTIQEGEEEVMLAEVEFELEEGGAALLERFDIILDYTGGEAADEDDAWEVFDVLYLLVDGDVIAEVDGDDEGDWEDRTTGTATGDDNRLRISGINHVFEAEADHTIEVAADIAGSVDLGADNQAAWTLTVDERALRFVDEAGITVYLSEEDTNTEETATFTIENEGQEDELTVRESNDDPESTALEVEDDQKSDWFNIFTFEVDVDEDSQDLTFNNILLTVATATANVDSVVDDFELRVDGKTFDDWSVNSGAASTTLVIDFDVEDEDFEIKSDEEVDVELWAEFKSANGTNYTQGETVMASLTSANVDAWDVDGGDTLTATQLQGAANGETHTLLVDGAVVTFESADEDALDTSDTAVNDLISVTFEIDVEAFDETIYIPVVAANALLGDIVNASTNASAANQAAIDTLTLVSSADEVVGTDQTYYEVSSSESFTVKMTEDQGAGDYYGELSGLLFTSADVTAGGFVFAANDSTIVLDEDEFKSGTVTLLN